MSSGRSFKEPLVVHFCPEHGPRVISDADKQQHSPQLLLDPGFERRFDAIVVPASLSNMEFLRGLGLGERHRDRAVVLLIAPSRIDLCGTPPESFCPGWRQEVSSLGGCRYATAQDYLLATYGAAYVRGGPQELLATCDEIGPAFFFRHPAGPIFTSLPAAPSLLSVLLILLSIHDPRWFAEDRSEEGSGLLGCSIRSVIDYNKLFWWFGVDATKTAEAETSRLLAKYNPRLLPRVLFRPEDEGGPRLYFDEETRPARQLRRLALLSCLLDAGGDAVLSTRESLAVSPAIYPAVLKQEEVLLRAARNFLAALADSWLANTVCSRIKDGLVVAKSREFFDHRKFFENRPAEGKMYWDARQEYIAYARGEASSRAS